MLLLKKARGKEEDLHRSVAIKEVFSIFKTSKVMEFSEENIFWELKENSMEVYRELLIFLLLSSLKNFSKKRDIRKIAFFLLN